MRLGAGDRGGVGEVVRSCSSVEAGVCGAGTTVSAFGVLGANGINSAFGVM